LAVGLLVLIEEDGGWVSDKSISEGDVTGWQR